MICPICGVENANNVQFCKQCGQPFARVNPVRPAPPPPFPPQSPVVVYPNYPQPMLYPPPAKRMTHTYTWHDICTIVGFVSSIVGIFTFWLVLSPLGLIGSILGFRSDRTRGLAVAGMIISILEILVKIGFILFDLNVIPRWLTSGVFW